MTKDEAMAYLKEQGVYRGVYYDAQYNPVFPTTYNNGAWILKGIKYTDDAGTNIMSFPAKIFEAIETIDKTQAQPLFIAWVDGGSNDIYVRYRGYYRGCLFFDDYVIGEGLPFTVRNRWTVSIFGAYVRINLY